MEAPETDENAAGETRRPGTLCVHGPHPPRRRGEPLVTPIVRSATFVVGPETILERSAGGPDGARVYSREWNPTVAACEERLAALEGAEGALLFASGMAAFHAALLSTLASGDRVLLARQLYGGSLELARALVPRLGAELSSFDVEDPSSLEAELDGRTRLVLCESLSNPLCVAADLPAIAERLRARAPRALFLVDATLATPIGQRPLELGADLVWHSATKALGGHGDLIAGVLAGREELLREAWGWRSRAGGSLDPEAASLVERGLKTLALRTRAQEENALALTAFLANHPRVARVHYAGHPHDPGHERARALLRHFGGLFSFVLRDGDDAARALLDRLELWTEAASLGGVESLMNRPVDLSHAALSADERARAGIAPGLLRASVGVEDVRDLVADLEQALAS